MSRADLRPTAADGGVIVPGSGARDRGVVRARSGRLPGRLPRAGTTLIVVARRRDAPRGTARRNWPRATASAVEIVACDLATDGGLARVPRRRSRRATSRSRCSTPGSGRSARSPTPTASARTAWCGSTAWRSSTSPGSWCRACVPGGTAGRSSIISSAAAWHPVPYMATYGATKAFGLHFVRALAEELRGTGVGRAGRVSGADGHRVLPRARRAAPAAATDRAGPSGMPDRHGRAGRRPQPGGRRGRADRRRDREDRAPDLRRHARDPRRLEPCAWSARCTGTAAAHGFQQGTPAETRIRTRWSQVGRTECKIAACAIGGA